MNLPTTEELLTAPTLVSECCGAMELGELTEAPKLDGTGETEMLGRCGNCKEMTTFVKEEA